MECLLYTVVLFFIVVFSLLGQSFGQDRSRVYGDMRIGDMLLSKKFIRADFNTQRSVYRTESVSQNKWISAVKFVDVWKTGASIDMSSNPPFKNFHFTITSQVGRGFLFEVLLYSRDTGMPGDANVMLIGRVGRLIYRGGIEREWRFLQVVTHTEELPGLSCWVQGVKLVDLWQTGASVHLEKYPPFRDFKCTFTSQIGRGFKYLIELYC